MRIRKKSVLSKQKKEPTLSDVILHIQKYATEVDAKFGSIDTKFEAMNTKMDIMHHEVQSMKGEITGVKNEVIGIKYEMKITKEELSEGMSEVKKKVETLKTGVDNLAKAVKDKREEQVAAFFNYTQVYEKVEHHDKDIAKIKLKLRVS